MQRSFDIRHIHFVSLYAPGFWRYLNALENPLHPEGKIWFLLGCQDCREIERIVLPVGYHARGNVTALVSSRDLASLEQESALDQG
jgi:hypothetical protein